MQNVVVQVTRCFKGIDCRPGQLKKLVRAICRRLAVTKAIVTIVIVGNSQIRKLNTRFLNRRTATDCLAFDLSDDTSERKLFELVVNGEKAATEAARRGHSPQSELALYVAHSLLHNLGFDDLSPQKAKKMHNLEDEILQQQGFGRVFDTAGKDICAKC